MPYHPSTSSSSSFILFHFLHCKSIFFFPILLVIASNHNIAWVTTTVNYITQCRNRPWGILQSSFFFKIFYFLNRTIRLMDNSHNSRSKIIRCIRFPIQTSELYRFPFCSDLDRIVGYNLCIVRFKQHWLRVHCLEQSVFFFNMISKASKYNSKVAIHSLTKN